MKHVGVISRGIKLPIVKEGEDLKKIVIDSVLEASIEGNFKFQDRDVLAITESLVARSQGNYCTVDDIATDIKNKVGEHKSVCMLYPILSRNRFSILLKGIAKAVNELVLVLSYPSDEVGNALLTFDQLDATGINPYRNTMDLDFYRKHFGENKHEFTGIDYVAYYKELVEEQGAQCRIFFSNQTKYFAEMGAEMGFDAYIAADIHTRARTKRLLKENGAKIVLGLDDIMTSSINGSGYNSKYGLLGSNKATEDTVKLFPEHGQELVEELQKYFKDNFNVNMEVMIYGDGAFKDPQGKIWELADPVVSPFYTSGLKGTPNEIKIKYFADNKFAELKGEELAKAIKEEIHTKDSNLVGNMNSEGTTPRQLTDLLGSLCDLTSGSGDKGTPVILIQNYFKNYSED